VSGKGEPFCYRHSAVGCHSKAEQMSHQEYAQLFQAEHPAVFLPFLNGMFVVWFRAA